MVTKFKYIALVFITFLTICCGENNNNTESESENVEKQITEESLYIVQDHWVKCSNIDCELSDPYYESGETVTWEGKCENGKANGYGVMKKFVNNNLHSVYTGEYKFGIREGNGVYELINKFKLECAFVNGQAIGQGKKWVNGKLNYEGDIVNYCCHGIGKLFYEDGTIEKGLFNMGILYIGKSINKLGKVTWENIVEDFKHIYIWDKAKDNIVCEYEPDYNLEQTIYFDANWEPWVEKGKAEYFRKVTFESKNKPKGLVKDFYITGELQNEFTAAYLDYFYSDLNFHEGISKWYYKSGQLEQIEYYYNNERNGKSIFYYEDGKIKSETNYKFGKINGNDISYYPSGAIKTYRNFINDVLVGGKSIEYESDGKNATIVYTENFYENRDKWGEFYFEPRTASGTSIIENKENVFGFKSNNFDFNLNGEISIEETITKFKGENNQGFGIIFGFKDWENYNEFIIAGDGNYKIYSYFEGIEIKRQDWKITSAINRGNGTNTLKIFKANDEFTFLINGKIIASFKDIVIRTNEIGFCYPPYSKFKLEGLIVKEFVSTEELGKRKGSIANGTGGDWKGNGSGFFLSINGYIATNFHVIDGANNIQVEYYQNGKLMKYLATVVVSDKQNDLAILKIEDPNFNPLEEIPYIFSTNICDVGEEVFTLGYPISNVMGQEVKFTDGKISARTGIQGDVQMYQISVPIQPGNSGGPLFDINGNLVGITSAGLNRDVFNAENVNYAIKSTYLKNLIDILPEKIELPNNTSISDKNLKEKIKVLSNIVPIIKVN